MKMDKLDLFDEMESEEGDQGLLEEIEQRRKEAKKNFSSIINKKKLNKYELDDIMA